MVDPSSLKDANEFAGRTPSVAGSCTAYGGPGQASLDDPEQDWSQFVISPGAFERVWNSPGA
jgi:hypothetical protein